MFELAEQNNSRIKAHTTAVKQAEENVKVAKNACPPSIDASLSFSYNGDGTILDRDFGNSFKAEIPDFGNNLAIEVSQVIYADDAYQSPENRKFAKSHDNMHLKTGKMQGGCRWELILHDEDGHTVREIATGNTYEAVKAVAKLGTRKRWQFSGTTRPGGAISKTRTLQPTCSKSRSKASRLKNSINATMSRQPCSNTVPTQAMERPDIGAC